MRGALCAAPRLHFALLASRTNPISASITFRIVTATRTSPFASLFTRHPAFALVRTGRKALSIGTYHLAPRCGVYLLRGLRGFQPERLSEVVDVKLGTAFSGGRALWEKEAASRVRFAHFESRVFELAAKRLKLDGQIPVRFRVAFAVFGKAGPMQVFQYLLPSVRLADVLLQNLHKRRL